jgi:hydrogenase-4 component F
MIFLVFAVIGFFIFGLSLLALMGRFRSVSSKNLLLNNLTLGHTILYIVATIFVIIRLPLPVYALSDYLFIDSLAIYEVVITLIVFLLAAIYGRGYINNLLVRGEVKPELLELFYGSFNLLLIVIIFCFFSNNLALFWILLELTTILSALLIVMLSRRENVIAALKYVFIASSAMLFSVIGLIILFAITKQVTGTGTLNWNELMQSANLYPSSLFTLAFAFLFIGFASKAGIAPFHTWLPQAHAKAPSVVSAVLSAVLLNCGIYGILRLYSIAHQTEASQTVENLLILFGVLSILIASLSMISRSNLKKLIGFSSIEHMGLILIGIGLGTPVAIFWTVFHTLAHSLIKSLLFFSAGILHHQYDSNKLSEMENALKIQPLASWGIIIGTLAVIGIPPFPIFFSKLFILIQLGNYSIPALIIALVLLLIVASAFAFLLIRALTRQTDKNIEKYIVPLSMKIPIIALLIAITVLFTFLPFGLNTIITGISSSLGF